jgi:aldose 1-epimerase
MPIGGRLNSAFQQMVYAHGYGGGMTFAARAYDPHSGRAIDCFTIEPGNPLPPLPH